MGLFRLRWLRKMIRRHTNPIAEDVAGKWERRLSVAYMIFGSNALIVVAYMIYTGRGDWAAYYGFKKEEDLKVPTGVQWAQTLGIKEAKVIRLSGFKKVDEYDIVDGQKFDGEVENLKEDSTTPPAK